MNASVRSSSLGLFLVILIMACAVQSRAQTSVSTNPVGYVQITCSANNDTVVSVPFQQPSAYVGLVAAVSGSTITLSGTPGWTTNQYVYSGSGSPTYYAQFGPNSSGTDPLDGMYFTVTSNGTNSLTVFLNGATIDGSLGGAAVSVGSSISLIPYWTLATVFPASASGTLFIPSNSPGSRQTQILMPNYAATGINNVPNTTYYFYNNQWCQFGVTSSSSYNDTVLNPDGYFIVRNPTVSTTLTALGSVLSGNFIIPLSTGSTVQQDNYIAICRPVATTLNALGLGNSAAFTTSASPGARKDQLLVWSGTQSGENTQPALDYFYYAGTSGTGWRLFGDSLSNDHGNDTIPAGSGVIIRKATTSNGNTALWQNPASY